MSVEEKQETRQMREIKKKSVIPIYGVLALWVLYCLICPLYRIHHFMFLAAVSMLGYVMLSLIFPGKTEYVEIPQEPVSSGDELIDALLREGETAVGEMRKLRDSMAEGHIRGILGEIITITDKIFKDLLDDPGDYKRVKRFADFYLPTTIKLLHTYDRFGRSGARGENVTGTLERIDTALGTIRESYGKFYDSLFENQALDIETDIVVLEKMLQSEGLLK